MVNNIPVNGWPQLKDLEAVQPTLDRLDKIEAWKRTVKEETFTGEEITIPNALALPARSLITEIGAIQDLHGYDHPWTGGAGKNLYGGTLSTIFDFPRILATDTVISVSLDKTGEGNVTMDLYKANETTRYDFFTLSGTGRVSRTVTLIGDTARVMFYADSGITAENIQIEVGSSATSYAPYSNICPISGRTAAVVTRSDGDEISEDFTIQLGQTVYGGSVDFTTGVASVTWAAESFDGSSSTGWSYVSDYGTVSRFDCMSVVGKVGGNVISNYLKGGNDASIIPNEDHVYLHGGYGYLIICVETSRLATKDVTGLMSYLASNNLQVCYELAEPIELTLSPTEVQMLKGYNRVTLSDGYGTIEIKALTGANWS